MPAAPPGSNPRPPGPAARPKTYLVIGASRGIGLEFCRQLLAANQRVIATARRAAGASQLWALTGSPNGTNLSILECDVADEESVGRFVVALAAEMGKSKRLSGGLMMVAGTGVNGDGGGVGARRGVIDVCVVNAGVLVYPNRVMEM
jgi:NAD(P)-dependent dehydrogenase (short-subunit alcohol dehydrogenase family)